MALPPIPVGHAALRVRGAVVEGIGDGGQALSARGLEQPLHVGAGEVAQLVESEGDVLDDEAVVALGARHLELVARDLLDRGGLNLGQCQRYAQ